MKTEFEGTAIIVIKKAKDLVVGDVTALNGSILHVSAGSRITTLDVKYPSGTLRKFTWKNNQSVRLA
jgi:hypothetical protein